MNQNRVTGLLSALCLALMFGLMWVGGAPDVALTLLGLGAALMVAVCVLAEFPCDPGDRHDLQK